MPTIDLPAGSFFYRFDGPQDAPVVVLSNSLGTDHHMWDPQMAALTRGFRVLRYDMRGHGTSAAPDGPYSIANLGDDLFHLAEALGIDRAHYCGLSLGGMVSMWLAIHHPDRIRSLLLCNTAARLGPRQLWTARIEAVRIGGMTAIVPAVIVRWFTPAFIEASPLVIAQMRQMLAHTPAVGYIACCEAIREMDQRDAVARIEAPTLVIAGALDAASPPADGRFLATTIPHARYIELGGAHLTNIEAAAPFNDTILGFLREQEAH